LKTGLKKLVKHKYLHIKNYHYRNKNNELVKYIKIEPEEGYCLKRIYVNATRPRNPPTVKYFVQTQDGLTRIATFTTNTDLYPVTTFKAQQKRGWRRGWSSKLTSTTRLQQQTNIRTQMQHLLLFLQQELLTFP